jgi:hypothetical protein
VEMDGVGPGNARDQADQTGGELFADMDVIRSGRFSFAALRVLALSRRSWSWAVITWLVFLAQRSKGGSPRCRLVMTPRTSKVGQGQTAICHQTGIAEWQGPVSVARVAVLPILVMSGTLRSNPRL